MGISWYFYFTDFPIINSTVPISLPYFYWYKHFSFLPYKINFFVFGFFENQEFSLWSALLNISCPKSPRRVKNTLLFWVSSHFSSSAKNKAHFAGKLFKNCISLCRFLVVYYFSKKAFQQHEIHSCVLGRNKQNQYFERQLCSRRKHADKSGEERDDIL